MSKKPGTIQVANDNSVGAAGLRAKAVECELLATRITDPTIAARLRELAKRYRDRAEELSGPRGLE
jgi:hypothetical protein